MAHTLRRSPRTSRTSVCRFVRAASLDRTLPANSSLRWGILLYFHLRCRVLPALQPDLRAPFPLRIRSRKSMVKQCDVNWAGSGLASSLSVGYRRDRFATSDCDR